MHRLLPSYVAAVAILTAMAARPAFAQPMAGTVIGELKVTQNQSGFLHDIPDLGLFGVAVATIGDLDQDGTGDIMIGAYTDNEFGEHTGAVYVVFLKPDGTTKSYTKIGSKHGGFNVTLLPFDMFGWSIADLGDLDGDGVTDVAVGAWLDDSNGTFDQGAIYVLFMKTDGTVKSWQKITHGVGGFTAMLYDQHRFGTSLTNLGDLDGDGVTDLMAGAIYDHDAAYLAGAVFVLFLKSDGTVKSDQKITMGQGGFFTVLKHDERFGYASTNLGDLDGDGVVDVAVSALLDHDGGSPAGAVYILFMSPGGYVKTFSKISATAGSFQGDLDEFDQFGTSVAAVPDLNGDGIVDLAVGVVGDDDGGDLRGAEYILFLGRNGSVRGETKISTSSGGLVGPLKDGDRFGQASCYLGDVDGNGTPDLAVGADHDDDGGTDSGAVWFLSLARSQWARVGYGTAGSNGMPSFVGSGTLIPGMPFSMDLSGARPLAPGIIAVSLDSLPMKTMGISFFPLLGPSTAVLPITVDATGSWQLASTWPSLLSHLMFYSQIVILDSGAPFGVAASNGLLANSP